MKKGVSENHAARLPIILAAFTGNGSALPIHVDIVTDLSSSLFLASEQLLHTHTTVVFLLL